MDISAPQEEESLISEERDTYMAEDMDYIDDQLVIGRGHRPPETPSGEPLSISSHDYPHEEQTSNDFAEFADEYRLHCSEDISQKI